MKCDLPIELLSGYLDGELDEQQKAQVEAHLKTCPACQEELDSLRRIDERVRGRVFEEPSREFMFTLNRRIMDKIRVAPRRSLLRLTPVFAPAAAALLILVILINLSPSKKNAGINDRIIYQKLEPQQLLPISIPEPKIAQTAAQMKRTARYDMEKTLAAGTEENRIAEVAEAGAMDEIETPTPTREGVVRAIIDTNGTIIKVATGNSLIPEKDTLLENELSGQQLAPPMIAGRKKQVYVEVATETKDE
jgi:hypothetical protein